MKCLKLPINEQLVLLLGLTRLSHPGRREDARRLLQQRLKEIQGSGKPLALPAYATHTLLMALLDTREFVSFCKDVQHDEALGQRDLVQFVRDSMFKTQTQVFELDPFFASRFSPTSALVSIVSATLLERRDPESRAGHE
jgi:hypothetical protein